MLEREPVHGMQGVLKRQRLGVFTFCPPMRKFRQAIESEGEAFRMSEPEGRRACTQRLRVRMRECRVFPKCTEDD